MKVNSGDYTSLGAACLHQNEISICIIGSDNISHDCLVIKGFEFASASQNWPSVARDLRHQADFSNGTINQLWLELTSIMVIAVGVAGSATAGWRPGARANATSQNNDSFFLASKCSGRV